MRHRRLPIDNDNNDNLSNEEVLCEIRRLFESFDKDLDQVSVKLAFVEGTVTEMKARNEKLLKILMAFIGGLLGLFGAIIIQLLF